MDFINDQALNTPDIPDVVPYVPGTVRGKKWVPPPKPQEPAVGIELEEGIELDIDLGDEAESALKAASTSEIIDLAGILGMHSMMNQEQYHSAQSEKWASPADPTTGWSGVTKATPLKEFPAEEPNRTNPDDIIAKLKSQDRGTKSVNLNNVPLSEDQFVSLFEALKNYETLVELRIANTPLGDFSIVNLAVAIESNSTLQKLNIESNCVSPQCLVKIFEVSRVDRTVYT